MRELLAKYHEMRAMRADGEPDPRDRMRRLAARFPGALREIDELPPRVLEARIAALEAVTRGVAAPPQWAVRVAAYHGWMRALLALRQAAGRARDLDEALAWVDSRYVPEEGQPTIAELRDVVQQVLRPPEGRMNRWLFVHLAARYGVGAAELEAELFPSRRRGDAA